MEKYTPEIDESPAPEGGFIHPLKFAEVSSRGDSGEGSGEEASQEKAIAGIVANIQVGIGEKDFSGPKDYEVLGKYEVNGIPVNTNELSELVDTLSPEDYGRTREVVEDALVVNDIAHDGNTSPEVRRKAEVATLANALFSAGESPVALSEVGVAQKEQMKEAQKIVEEEGGVSRFSTWVSTKGKRVVGAVLAVVGLSAAAPAFAGDNRYGDRAATVGVRVLGDVLGTKAETPFRIAQEMGEVRDRAERAAQNADLRRVEQERQLSVRERDQLNRVAERVEVAELKFATEFKIYKLKHTDATERDFIATKMGESLYRQVLQAQDRAALEVKKIKHDSEAARARTEEQYVTQQDRINAQAESDAHRVHRNAQKRELDVMGRGAREVSRAVVPYIFRR